MEKNYFKTKRNVHTCNLCVKYNNACRTNQQKLPNKTIEDPFFYKDNSIVLNHLKKVDEKIRENCASEKLNSRAKKNIHQKCLESFYKIDDGTNQRIIVQLDQENQHLFQITQLQQKRIMKLEEMWWTTVGEKN